MNSDNNQSKPGKQMRQHLPAHQPPADAAAYLAAVSDEEKRLVTLAIERLGSSYFMEKSHGYLAWKAKNKRS
jgi:hypothetical protein